MQGGIIQLHRLIELSDFKVDPHRSLPHRDPGTVLL